jgi:ABC-type polysaccharide/polyol phosphate transport system ATPase subunit
MSDIVIRAENLGKRYRIGERERYVALRDVLARAVSAPARIFNARKPASSNGNATHIWALKDVSFEVRQGEAVGIIGRNGSGKTTLLKILAQVTRPTEGRAQIRGRVGSLLEVGTGFHPELTGRENVFLSGAILGMRKAEILRKFNEIVAFAEVEKFIDTPLKHFSTGMQMRLAFAVAAHLDPEILLVDEVLAVGDLEFQKKCIGKMSEVAKGGRTVLFVSHQMNQIRRLCERIIWVDGGRIRLTGPTGEGVSAYEAEALGDRGSSDRPDAPWLKAQFQRWEIVGPETDHRNVLHCDRAVEVRFILKVTEPIRDGQHGIALYNADGQLLWGNAVAGLQLRPGTHQLSHCLAVLPLKPGAYSWRVTLYDDLGMVDDWSCLPELLVATMPVAHRVDQWAGILNLPSRFSVSTLGVESK